MQLTRVKTIFLIGTLFIALGVSGQIPTYYNNVNLTLTGMPLKSELAQKITNTHTTQLQYNDVWNVLQQTDLDPSNSNNVLLLYGYNDGDGNPVTDRTRNKYSNGGNNGEWNREHTYAQSLANPNMNTSSPNAGTDAHHLRSTDVQMNGNRGNRKFASGSGNAGTVGSNWYPGNEWKGDVARMMMYMYLRYSTQCAPNNVGVGSSVAVDPAMIDLFLQWNAEDDVSTYEINRNNLLETGQGNRNPFIDNPYLATIIWGGTPAQDYWNMNSTDEYGKDNNLFNVYPVPSNNGEVHVYFKQNLNVDEIEVYSINGKKVFDEENPQIQNNEFVIEFLPKGFYVLKAVVGAETIAKKIVVN